MRKNCLKDFCSDTFGICKLPLDLFLKNTTKAEYLAPKEDDEVDGWLSGRNKHQKHLELSWYPDERIWRWHIWGWSCIWRGMALPSLGLRPISSSALCASLIATESAESNLPMTGWEHEKRLLSLGHWALDPSLMWHFFVRSGDRRSQKRFDQAKICMKSCVLRTASIKVFCSQVEFNQGQNVALHFCRKVLHQELHSEGDCPPERPFALLPQFFWGNTWHHSCEWMVSTDSCSS